MTRRSILLLIALAIGCAKTPAHETAAHPGIAPRPPDPDSVIARTTAATTHQAARNIFAFREAPVVAVVVTTQPQPRSVVATVAQIPAPAAPAGPEFTYRCIGTFGPARHRFAVFANADGIVNASIGEVVGESEFVLREIGVESVLLEAKAGALTRRIEIGR